jgi:formyltetrahydrofolate deformylase
MVPPRFAKVTMNAQKTTSRAGKAAGKNGSSRDYLLTLSCADTLGIVHAVAAFLHDSGCNIIDSAQFGDPDTGRFFMRVHFAAVDRRAALPALDKKFRAVARQFGMDWQFHDTREKPRMLILVSKFDHCLHDLLYRYRNGELNCEISSVVSNHRELYRLAASYDVPFHHLPLSDATKAAQEEKLLGIIRDEGAELVVLARYMQILSEKSCGALEGRAINIHHSFLPSFKGAMPYHQAHARGVKLIGATAHFVTAALDEGPIIEQDTTRVDHKYTPAEMVAAGRDVERMVLARAVKLYLDRRVLLNGHKTVVFR